MDPNYKYWAFISYSHQDPGWSDWLFKALETYRIPRHLVGRDSRMGAVPPRLFPVFRDRDELPGSAELSANLVEALRASRFLVVICSPHSARSRWVNEEIRMFKSMGGETRVLALVTSGEPNASDKPDSGMLECFPPALRFRGGDPEGERAEPIAADVRPGKDGKPAALLRLVAGLIGVSFDELRQRERQRARVRNMRFAAGACALLSFAVLDASWLWTDARIERDVEAGRTAMMSREYARAAQNLVAAAKLQSSLPFARERKYLPAMLGIAMARVELLQGIENLPGRASYGHEVNSSRTLLVQSLLESRIVVASLDGATPTRVFDVPATDEFSPVRFDRGDQAITYHAGERVMHLELATGKVRELMADPKGTDLWALTAFGAAALYRFGDHREFIRIPDGKVLARFEGDRVSRIDDLRIYDPKGEKALASMREGDGWSVAVVDLVDGGISRRLHLDAAPSAAQFDSTGTQLAIVSGFADWDKSSASHERMGTIGVWDLATGKARWRVRFPAAFREVSFSADGTRLVTTSQESRAIVWNVSDGRPELFLEDADAQIREAGFFPDGARVWTFSQDGSPRVWELATGSTIAKLDGLGGYLARVVPLPDGRGLAAYRTQGQAQLLRWRVDDRRTAGSLAGHDAALYGVDLTTDGSRAVSFDESGTAIVWDARTLRPVATLHGDGEDMSISADGRLYAAWGTKDPHVRIAEVDGGRVLAYRRLDKPLRRVAGWSSRGLLAIADGDNQVATLDAALEMHVLGKYDHIHGFDASVDGSRVAVVSGEHLDILDATTGAVVARFPAPAETGGEPSVQFSRSNRRLLVNYYRKPEIVDLATGTRHSLDAAGGAVSTTATFVCDDAYVALALDGHRFQLHDATNGEHLRDFDGALAMTWDVACDTSAGLLIGADRSGSVTVWRISGGPPIAQFKLSRDSLLSTRWIPGLRTALVSSRDSRLYTLPIPLETRSPEELEAVLRARRSGPPG